ncbi:MAG: malate dehydrogenase [Candidatus Omnitrophica bacterium]|nr:malate dehydrogenase [Candidatus Omnitrophota bacterium]
MARPKVTVVGAGFVGATTAQRIVEKNLADVVLTDIVEGLPQGKALDMMESAPVEGFDAKISGTNDYAETKDSNLIVITAGLARKPGMSRDDLLQQNAQIVRDIVTEVAKHSPKALILVVTNPLDVMVYLTWKKSGFETKRVFGMAGALDSARYSYFISEELQCKPSEVDAMVLGGHGDEMVPVPEHTKAKGKPITELLKRDRIEAINQRTRDGGAEIVKHLKTGSAFYAPSSCVVRMVENILKEKGEIIPSCAYCTGQFGIKDIYCGVPVRFDRSGVKEIVEITLTSEEKKALQTSAEHVRENVAKLSL